MTLGLVYWILMLLWLVFGLYTSWPGIAGGNFGAGVGGSLLLFILLLILGWQTFGPPLRRS